jgi:hypothetical protein
MTRSEILAARQWRASQEGVELPANSVGRPNTVVEIPESVRKAKVFDFNDVDPPTSAGRN